MLSTKVLQLLIFSPVHWSVPTFSSTHHKFMTHILIWPTTNPSPFIPPTTASYKHKRDALPDRLTIYSLFQEACSFLKAPLKPNGRVSSYLHPWHRLVFLPGQGCLAHMHKIARDSPKPPIRDKLICCILLQGHFFKLPAGGRPCKQVTLISSQNQSSMFSFSSPPLITLPGEITPLYVRLPCSAF